MLVQHLSTEVATLLVLAKNVVLRLHVAQKDILVVVVIVAITSKGHDRRRTDLLPLVLHQVEVRDFAILGGHSLWRVVGRKTATISTLRRGD